MKVPHFPCQVSSRFKEIIARGAGVVLFIIDCLDNQHCSTKPTAQRYLYPYAGSSNELIFSGSLGLTVNSKCAICGWSSAGGADTLVAFVWVLGWCKL